MDPSVVTGLAGDFITEAARLMADSFDHSLERPATLVTLYATLARIRIVSTDTVFEAAQECCDRIVELYAQPNRRIDELDAVLRSSEFEFFQRFSEACRSELQKYSVT